MRSVVLNQRRRTAVPREGDGRLMRRILRGVGIARRSDRGPSRPKIMYVITEDWFFCSHFLDRARAARDCGYEVVVMARVGGCGEKIRAADLRLVPMDFRRTGTNPLRDAALLLQLYLVYRRERPDLVHHVATKPIIYGSLAAVAVGTPAIVNAPVGMGYVFSSRQRLARLLRPFLRLAYRVLLNPPRSRVIFENPDDAREFADNGFVRRTDGVVIRGAGVDLHRYQPAQSPPSGSPPQPGPPVVALVARMLREKGVYEFVAAAHRLHDAGTQARFVLIGAPDPENPASVPVAQLRAWHGHKGVEWWRWQEDMPSVWQKVDVGCLPSSYREGLPKALLEAAACGLPIVTTDAVGCREVVQNGSNGFLVPTGDVPALANGLNRLICDANLRRRMGKQGRARAEREFSSRHVNGQTLAVYRSLVGDGRDKNGLSRRSRRTRPGAWAVSGKWEVVVIKDLRQKFHKLGVKFTDLHATTGSLSRASYYLLKFCGLRAGAVAGAAVRSVRSRRQRVDITRHRDTPGEPPLIAIKLTGGLGDYVVAARYLRDLAACVEPFRFDVYCANPDMGRWIFGSNSGLRAAYSEFLFEDLKGTYPLALWVSQFVVFYRETADWSAIRKCGKLCAALQSMIRFRTKIAPLVDAHPFMDGYLAHKAVYMNLSRRNFLHGMSGIPYGGDELEIAVSDAGLLRYGLQAGNYITVHNGFDPTFVITSRTATKTYPGFDEVVRQFRSLLPGVPIVQIGTRTSQPIVGVDLNLVDKVSMREAAGILKHSRFHVDIESGLVHFASCFSVRSCVLFGPTPADYFAYPANINLRPSECGGCWWINQTWMDQCPRGLADPVCMTGHDPRRVASAVADALTSARPKLLAVAEA